MNEGLFLEDKRRAQNQNTPTRSEEDARPRSRTPDDIWGEEEDSTEGKDERYNENESSVKRRKMSSTSASAPNEQSEDEIKPAKAASARKATSGPFIDESDSEDDLDAYQELDETADVPDFNIPKLSPPINGDAAGESPAESEQPPLVREDTHDDNDEYENFDDDEGREFVDEFDYDDIERPSTELCSEDIALINELQALDRESRESLDTEPTCPSCQGPLTGLSEQVGFVRSSVRPHTYTL